jgi:hypothetical protein
MAAFAAVPAAQASTLYACVTKSGTAHVYTKKPKKCRSKKEKLVSWNTAGPAGKNGINGTNGSNGVNGINGAVAGFSATESGGQYVNGTLTQIPGLVKTLPAGSFIASTSLEFNGYAESAPSGTIIECQFSDNAGGKITTEIGYWGGPFLDLSGQYIAKGQIALHLAITASQPSTLTVKCKQEVDLGSSEEVATDHGALVAVQTSANS